MFWRKKQETTAAVRKIAESIRYSPKEWDIPEEGHGCYWRHTPSGVAIWSSETFNSFKIYGQYTNDAETRLLRWAAGERAGKLVNPTRIVWTHADTHDVIIGKEAGE